MNILIVSFCRIMQMNFLLKEYDYVVDAVDTVTAKIALVMKCKRSGYADHQQYGAGNKLDASAFRVTDIYKRQRYVRLRK